MRLDSLISRQGGCIECPESPPLCNCAANEDCFQINRDCTSCSKMICVAKKESGGKPSGGVSKGATAGAIIGALVFLTIIVTLFLWYRRKMRFRNSITTGHKVPKDIPAPAETVLNRPDPTEKPVSSPDHHSSVRVYSISSNTTIDLDPESQHSSQHSYNPSRRPTTNPFDDSTSIQTAGTEGTNVIPIALVSPDSHRPFSPASETNTRLSTTSTFPVRPARSPELNLNLDHVNISRDSVRGTNLAYALSQRSGISGVSSRNSYMSNASYSSDFLNEAPMIITPTKGAVRQVLGVVKAEMINAPGSSHALDSLRPPSSARPSVGSPLASTSFGPADLVKEGDGNQTLANPFSDEASIDVNYSASPASATAFVHSSTGAVRDSHSEWIADTPTLPWAQSHDQSRPSSMSTQAGSVIDIGSATRVNVGLKGLSGNYALASSQLSPNSAPRSPYRTTMGKLVSPSTAGSGTLEEQQQVALAHAQAQTRGMELNRRISISSAMSATSTRADSILESFPFVPPSPISNRPVRSPPVSPLSQQAFNGGPPSPLGQQHTINVAPPSPLAHQTFSNDGSTVVDEPLPNPPSRRTLGLSTASQFSTASSGLGSFPFQIDSGTSTESGAAPQSAFNGRQRASLDTLALTSDLSSYPLGFDNDSVQVPQIPHKS